MNIAVIARIKTLHAAVRLQEEAIRQGHSLTIIEWGELHVETNESETRIGTDTIDLSAFDVIIPRNDHYSSIRDGDPLSRSYSHIFDILPFFSSRRSIHFLNGTYFSSMRQSGKLSQQVFLADHGLPGISTCSLRYHLESSDIPFDYPVILKDNIGSRGIGVFKVSSFEEARRLVRERGDSGENMIAQQYYPINRDFRVIVVGDTAIGAIERRSQDNEWRTNVSLGGKTSVVTDERLRKSLLQLGLRAAKALSLEYAGVDILEYDKELHIIEINSLPQFEGFEKTLPDTNVALSILRYIEAVRAEKYQ